MRPLFSHPIAQDRSEAHDVIVAEGLTKVFGGFVAVDHISFKVQRGEIFGFFGS